MHYTKSHWHSELEHSGSGKKVFQLILQHLPEEMILLKHTN